MTNIASIITQLEQQRNAIDRALQALQGTLQAGELPAKKQGRPPGTKRGGPRTMSPEGRARIAEAARKRWAEKRKEKKAAK